MPEPETGESIFLHQRLRPRDQFRRRGNPGRFGKLDSSAHSGGKIRHFTHSRKHTFRGAHAPRMLFSAPSPGTGLRCSSGQYHGNRISSGGPCLRISPRMWSAVGSAAPHRFGCTLGCTANRPRPVRHQVAAFIPFALQDGKDHHRPAKREGLSKAVSAFVPHSATALHTFASLVTGPGSEHG